MARSSLQVKVFSGRRIDALVVEIDNWLREGGLEPTTETVCSDFVDGILISVTVTAEASGYIAGVRYLGVQGNTDKVNAFLESQFNTQDSRKPLHTAVSKSGWDVVMLIRYEQMPIEIGHAVESEPQLESAASAPDPA